jgi:hypothetical protein
MKRFHFALLCAALPIVARSSHAQALDEVDRLLANESVAAPLDVPTSESLADRSLIGREATHDGGRYWQPPVGAAGDVARVSSGAADEKPAATEGISLVPEPSAIALAVLALIYFLIFGRRRNTV